MIGDKKEVGAKQNSLPVDRVIQMRAQGLTNNQIVEALQREGYSTTQIFDALNQADLRGATGVTPQAPMPGQPSNPIQLQPQVQQDPAGMPQQPAYQQQFQMQESLPSAPAAFTSPSGITEDELIEKIEEVTETIIEEKWKDFVETVEKIIEWKNAFTERVDKLASELEHLRNEFDRLHVALLKKLEQYDKSMGNVGAQLKAMEMVFKDVLPKFTENVKQLSELAEDLSKKKKR